MVPDTVQDHAFCMFQHCWRAGVPEPAKRCGHVRDDIISVNKALMRHLQPLAETMPTGPRAAEL
jgi:hypothetical protein